MDKAYLEFVLFVVNGAFLVVGGAALAIGTAGIVWYSVVAWREIIFPRKSEGAEREDQRL